MKKKITKQEWMYVVVLFGSVFIAGAVIPESVPYHEWLIALVPAAVTVVYVQYFKK